MMQAISCIAIWCATIHDNTTLVAYDSTTHQMKALPMMHCFLTKNWLATLHIAVSFQLILYTDIKIVKRYYRTFFISLAFTNTLVHCNEFASKQKERNIQTKSKKVGVKINHN